MDTRGTQGDHTIERGGQAETVVAAVVDRGEPRVVRVACLMLRDALERRGEVATQMVIGPWLSPRTREIIVDHGMGYADFVGNARIALSGTFIERAVGGAAGPERRRLGMILGPKGTRVLMAMLCAPGKAWRVEALRRAAGVSLGHASNVRRALLDREWAIEAEDGVALQKPGEVLDAWCEGYRRPVGRRVEGYTHLHGAGLEEALRKAMDEDAGPGKVLLASFSAARWLAPYARTGTERVYADLDGERKLRDAFGLRQGTRGTNVEILVPDDPAILDERIEPAAGIACTNPVRTYLDMSRTGERGREAAEHLRRKCLEWTL